MNVHHLGALDWSDYVKFKRHKIFSKKNPKLKGFFVDKKRKELARCKGES